MVLVASAAQVGSRTNNAKVSDSDGMSGGAGAGKVTGGVAKIT